MGILARGRGTLQSGHQAKSTVIRACAKLGKKKKKKSHPENLEKEKSHPENFVKMQLHQLLLLSIASQTTVAQRLVEAGSLTECKARGGARVCDGAVTKELKSTTPSVQVCGKGKVGKGAPVPGGECEWYGQLYCSGDIIIDLYSWKFLKKCADGKMGIYGRSWQEVSEDPRFKDDVRKIRKQLRRRR